MKFANVKGITIPEGAVKALSIGGVKVWSAVTVDKYSWEAVFASIDAGTYATDYAIGDCVPLDLGSEGVINMQIAAFDVDDLADGSGKAPVTFIAKELLAEAKEMNSSNNATGGWENCKVRTVLKNTIKPLIAENVANRIATVTKTQKVFDSTNAELNQTTQDDVWIPDHSEVFNSGIYTMLFNDNDARIKNKIGIEYASKWWLRSGSNATNYRAVRENGENITDMAKTSKCICLSFCLA